MSRPLLLLALLAITVRQSLSAAETSSEIWLGATPICHSDASTCKALDLQFDHSDKAGDGSTCWTGEKALCKFRPLIHKLATTPAARLTVVSYNVFARPYLVSHDGQLERTCRIPRVLLSAVPTADVIVFQEAFQPGCLGDGGRLTLRGLLRNYGLEYSTRTVGERRWGLRINGGVFIASRWPITHQAQMVYRASHPRSADSLANKGAVYARIDKLGVSYHVFGTHLQAEDGPEFDRYRELQAKELHQFVQSRGVDPTEPVVIAGDFNADLLANGGHVSALLGNLDATLPRLRGDVRATYDPKQNDVVEAGITASQWLDYVVHSRAHRRPRFASLRSIRLLADRELSICVRARLQPAYVSPESSGCGLAASTRHLSDHFPVVADFQF